MPRSSRPSLMNLFPAAPNVEQYSAVGSIEEARRRLTQAVRDAEGVGLLIGPPGTGKSLVCCLLAESLRDDFDVVLLADTRLTTRRMLLQNMMFHMDLPYQGLSEGELRLALMDRLTKGTAAAGKEALVLIIDEAQSLPARLLEEVRMINNVVRDGTSRVRTVLAGGVELDDRFAQPQLESLSQRVAARCYLHPLNREETARYIRDALMRAGEDPHALINDEAIVAVHHACAGVPRLINQMMRQAIQIARGATIDGQTVQQAWAGLQQLASPVIDVRPLRLSGGDAPQLTATAPECVAETVEFGGLSAWEPLPQQALAETDCGGACGEEPLLASFEVGAGECDRPPVTEGPRQSWDETAPELAAELDRVTASLEELARDVIDSTAAEVWDEQCLPTASQTTSDREECQYVLPMGDAAAEICSLYTQLAPPPETDGLLWQEEFQAGDALRQDDRPLAAELHLPAPPAAELQITERQITELPAAELKIAELWDAEPSADELQRTLTTATALFGDDFDQEELIPLSLQGATSRRPAADAKADELLCDPELLLHREIVRIAAEASRVDFTDDVPSPPHRATLPLQRLCSERTAGNDAGDIELSDDSDLLVVEDGVELGAYGSFASSGASCRTDGNDIDFKTLFSRLRHG